MYVYVCVYPFYPPTHSPIYIFTMRHVRLVFVCMYASVLPPTSLKHYLSIYHVCVYECESIISYITQTLPIYLSIYHISVYASVLPPTLLKHLPIYLSIYLWVRMCVHVSLLAVRGPWL